MIQETIAIVNELGLHARAAAKFVNMASNFTSQVKLSRADKPEEEVDGKSILGVLLLAAALGSSIIIRVKGADEDSAMSHLKNLVADGFGEMDEKREPVPLDSDADTNSR